MTTPIPITVLGFGAPPNTSVQYNNLVIKQKLNLPQSVNGKSGYITAKQCFIDYAPQSQRPPSAMTANNVSASNVVYNASLSGPGGTTADAWKLFDRDHTTEITIANDYVGGNNTTGAYHGTPTTIDDNTGTSYSGAWIQLQMTAASDAIFYLTLESMQVRATNTSTRPRSVIIFGSGDGTTWYAQSLVGSLGYVSNLATFFANAVNG